VQRIRLLSGMIILGVLMAAAVVWGSPYAPVVQPCPESIEEIWAIEDARTESERPLITVLENNGIPLAYDAQENTFYCTLGMGNAESWPQLHLLAPEAKGVSVLFVDDYTYDFCSDAIREGYSYQLMAYNDAEFAYFNIVFTGMRQLHIHTNEEVSKEDSAAEVIILDETGAMESHGRVHYRGNASMKEPKKGMKVEFTRNSDGTHKMGKDVPELGYTENLVLLPLFRDDTMMREKLSWSMYADMAKDSESFGPCKTAYVELFVNDRYEGVYLMMNPYDNVKELEKWSASNPATDSVYRVSWLALGTQREVHPGAYLPSRGFELYYSAPQSVHFADLKAYMEMSEEEDDEEFARKALACMDMEYAMRYVLLLQGLGLTDNVFNNLSVWARHDGGQIMYHYYPWDLDNSMGLRRDRIGGDFERWIYLPAVDRMISLDAGGIRGKLLDMWTGLRADSWSLESVEARINRYTTELNDSGAFARNAQRWNLEKTIADGYEIISFISTRFAMLDQVLSNFAAHDGKIEMLDYTDYENRSCSLTDWFGY